MKTNIKKEFPYFLMVKQCSLNMNHFELSKFYFAHKFLLIKPEVDTIEIELTFIQ